LSKILPPEIIGGERGGIFVATAVFMVAIVVALAISYALTRHLPMMPMVTAAIVVVFGGVQTLLGTFLSALVISQAQTTLEYILSGSMAKVTILLLVVAVLYFRPRAERDSEEFYASSRYGELWVGVRPSLEEVAALTGLEVRHLDELADALGKDVGEGGLVVRVVRGADGSVEAVVAEARAAAGVDEDAAKALDVELARALSELRLLKDEWEVEQMRLAVEVTARGFEDIVRSLADAEAHPRGERVVETAFEGRARREGNGVGYDTIAASGPHACTLHWIRNDGAVRDGDLILVDAGAEVDSLYTADVTRTIPVNGRFTEAQRKVYEAVLEAADAAFEVARPGRRFRELHEAAMQVIAARLVEWGLVPSSVEETLSPDGQFHRRWMVHGTSHHLGLDVHDCAQARKELYLDAVLEPGMVFTIEPGLYFRAEDELVPERLRGIGVRIEDDVLVTEDGCVNLSAALPRQPVEIEAWMASLR